MLQFRKMRTGHMTPHGRRRLVKVCPVEGHRLIERVAQGRRSAVANILFSGNQALLSGFKRFINYLTIRGIGWAWVHLMCS